MQSRRDALKTGVLGLVGGWLGLRSLPAEAKEGRTLPAISEAEEVWNDQPVHVIEMTLPYDDPVLMFLIGHRRYLVPRFNAEEMRHGIERNRVARLHTTVTEPEPEPEVRSVGDIKDMLRQRAAQVVQNYQRASRDAGSNPHVTFIQAHCPSGTDYGLLASPEPLRVANLLLTVPAPVLFG